MTKRSDNNSLEFSAMSEMTAFAKNFSSNPEAGEALLGFGEASGSERASRAARSAFGSSLWKNVAFAEAKAVRVQVAGSRDITLQEVGDAMSHIYSTCSNAHVYYSHTFDDALADRLQITVIATGFPR